MIAIGSDHGGFKLKADIIKHLKDKGYQIKDFGIYEEHPADYPDIAVVVAESIINGECEKGIIICGTGIGISISANKIPGIRAALCTDSFMARMCTEHNNANVLALGARVIGVGVALDIVDTWLNTVFGGERHKTRVDKISLIEKKYLK